MTYSTTSKSIFQTVTTTCTFFGLSRSTLYEILKEIEGCKRYRGIWIRRDRFINQAVISDYLHYRKYLKSGLSEKHLPEFNQKEAVII